MTGLHVVKDVDIKVHSIPVPWSVPVIYRYGGCRPNPRLAAWQAAVAGAARLAWGPLEPTSDPVSLKLTFFLPRTNESDSGVVVPILKLNRLTGKITKRGLAQADLTNLAKGTEDALEGIVFVNDILVRHKEEIAYYGDADEIGVWINVGILKGAT